MRFLQAAVSFLEHTLNVTVINDFIQFIWLLDIEKILQDESK